MKWAGHVARIEERRGAYTILVGKLFERRHLEYLGVDGSIILKWIFRKLDVEKDWIVLARDRDRWPTLVNAVVNRRVP